MKQCRQCFRFFGDDRDHCAYCDGPLDLLLFRQIDEDLKRFSFQECRLTADGRSYEAIEPIGQGSHGMVLAVRDEDGRHWALKVPIIFNEMFSNQRGHRKAELEISRKYIEHEVKMVKQYSGEALIRVEFSGEVTCRSSGGEASFPAVLMELAEGSLKDLIEKSASGEVILPISERKEIVLQLLENMERLHSEGLIHRDISPHNIFIVDRGGDIRFVLADFGTSKNTLLAGFGDSSTRMAFHDCYLDPLLLRHEGYRYNPRLDMYQMAVVCTEILLGRFWADEGRDWSVAEAEDLDFYRDFLSLVTPTELPEILLDILKKATSPKFRKRFSESSDFCRAVAYALDSMTDSYPESDNSGRVFKKIQLGFHFRMVPGETDGQSNVTRIDFFGQKRVEMEAASIIEIVAPDIEIKRANVKGTPFLKCRIINGYTIRVFLYETKLRKLFSKLLARGKEAGSFLVELTGRGVLEIRGDFREKDGSGHDG